jgi:hypothetical protein
LAAPGPEHPPLLSAAGIVLIFLWHDVYKALWFEEGGIARFGIGVGTLVLLLNTSLLTGYTLSCHSLRHLVGGNKDCLSRHPMCAACYSCVTGLNKKHMLWAWFSLCSVGFADVYVRLLSMGIWTDWRIL